MDYKTARPLIQRGDIIAFSHDDIGSQVIRMATRSEYTHVGIAWPVAGRVMILEAVIPKIRIFPLSKLTPFYWISLDRPMSPEAEEYALSRVGEDYSIMEAIKGYFGLTRDDRKWQCAEYAKAVLTTTGSIFHGNDTPSDVVYDALNQNGIISMVTK